MDLVEGPEPAGGSRVRVAAVDVAELDAGLARRVVGVESPADQLFGAEREMMAELLGHVRLEIAAAAKAAPERAEPRDDPSDRHQMPCGMAVSTAAITATWRRQLVSSAASRRFPALVR